MKILSISLGAVKLDARLNVPILSFVNIFYNMTVSIYASILMFFPDWFLGIHRGSGDMA